MPALAAACLTMAWFFCRGALIEVWKRNLSRLPSLARIPSAPRFQPAASRTWLALSTLNSQRVFLERKRDGRVEEVGAGLPAAPVDLLLDRGPVHEQVQRLAHRRDPRGPGAWSSTLRPLAVHLGPRVGEVALDVLGVAGRPDVDPALAALLHAPEDVVLHLQVPRVVVLAGLQHRARRGHRVAAALHLDGVEERAVGHVVGRVRLPAHDVARLEVGEPVRAGADRLQVGGRLAALRALERLEHVLRAGSCRDCRRTGPPRTAGAC